MFRRLVALNSSYPKWKWQTGALSALNRAVLRQMGSEAQHLGWISETKRTDSPAVASEDFSLSTFALLEFHLAFKCLYVSDHYLRRKWVLWASKPWTCLLVRIKPSGFDALLTCRRFLLHICTHRSKTQSKLSYAWHQDTLAKTILINYIYNRMLYKPQLDCLMYHPIILGM